MQINPNPDTWSYIKEHWYSIVTTIGIILVAFKDHLLSVLNFNQNKKLTQENINSNHIQNLEETFGLYKKIIDDLVTRYELKIDELKEEIHFLRVRTVELEETINKLKSQISKQNEK